MHFQWNTEKLLTIFFEYGKEKVFQAAGVKDPHEETAKSGGESISCPT